MQYQNTSAEILLHTSVKKHFEIGQTIEIKIETREAGYLTVFVIEENEALSLLYPNAFTTVHQKLLATEHLKLPDTEQWTLRAAPPAGKILLVTVLTQAPGMTVSSQIPPDFDSLFSTLQSSQILYISRVYLTISGPNPSSVQ